VQTVCVGLMGYARWSAHRPALEVLASCLLCLPRQRRLPWLASITTLWPPSAVDVPPVIPLTVFALGPIVLSFSVFFGVADTLETRHFRARGGYPVGKPARRRNGACRGARRARLTADRPLGSRGTRWTHVVASGLVVLDSHRRSLDGGTGPMQLPPAAHPPGSAFGDLDPSRVACGTPLVHATDTLLSAAVSAINGTTTPTLSCT
jgi:hypothetical protein